MDFWTLQGTSPAEPPGDVLIAVALAETLLDDIPRMPANVKAWLLVSVTLTVGFGVFGKLCCVTVTVIVALPTLFFVCQEFAVA